MQQQEHSSRKLIKRRPINPKPLPKLPIRRKNHSSLWPFPTQQQRNAGVRQVERSLGLRLNEQNISLIAQKQQASFISRQDHSLDSFDKMIMGVDEELDLEEQNTSNSKDHEPNYSLLYHQFQRLIKLQRIYEPEISRESSGEVQEREPNSHILTQQIEQERQREGSFQRSGAIAQTVHQKVQQIREMRRLRSLGSDPNISLRLVGANLSQIEEEFQHNSSMNRMDPIQQQFIDFVSKNEAGKINISKIENHIDINKGQKKPKFRHELSLKEAEEDEVVAMLENQLGSRSRREGLIEEQSILDDQRPQKPTKSFEKSYDKGSYQKENYNQILRELDENQDKKLDCSHNGPSLLQLLAKREQWINSRSDRTSNWKRRELQLLSRLKQIAYNPYVEFSDEQDPLEL